MGDEDDDFRRTGRVTFDDRGNALWEWSLGDGAFSADVSSTRLKKLEHPSLAIADHGPPTGVHDNPLGVHDNPLGTKKGYHPYDSGKLSKPGTARRKKDLRRLSEWLELKKQHEALKKGDDSAEE